TATFLATDTTQTQVIARLNAAAGYAAFAQGAGTVTSFTGRHPGTAGSVEITAVSGVLVTTATGFSVAAATGGTGNVADIKQVTADEIAAAVATATSNDVAITVDENGNLRATNTDATAGAEITVHANTTATALGFTAG